jgi:hypothetical protein
MNEEKIEKIYRTARIIIFSIPALAVLIGLYLILFPVDFYNFYPDDPKLSKFEISKNPDKNQLTFGVFPWRHFRYIDLTLNFKKSEKISCQKANPEVWLEKTYQAYLYPAAETITTPDQLRNFLFDSNKTKYPNGSLLHLKPTNEVFLISRGKKILFPGPEIFTAFGYSFDNLTEVDQSDIDQFPDADQRVFLWTMAHPDGTIFQSFPSHSLFLVFEGKKYPIASQDLLDEVWPENFTIAVSDPDPENILKCSAKEGIKKIFCQFDSTKLSSLGGFYYFSVNFPADCSINAVHPGNSRIRFSSERSLATVKDSLKNIAASVLNRYFYKQY